MSFAAPTIVILLTGMVWANVFHHVGTFLGLLSAGIAIALKDLLENMTKQKLKTESKSYPKRRLMEKVILMIVAWGCIISSSLCTYYMATLFGWR